jgi:hypothetical protein
VAAPLAVAWPHGAPAIGAGALIALLPVALAEGVPRLRLSFGVAIVLAGWIAIAGDAGLARGGGAGIAIAAAALVSFRTAHDVRLAAGAFGATASLVAVAAALHGTTGVRADILAVAATLGLAMAAGTGLWGVAAADLAGVLALPSRAGLIAVAALLVALALADRRNVLPSLLGALAIAAAWLAGAPPAHAAFVHGAWRHASAFADSYHRLGAAGAALLALLLLTLLTELPRALAPAAFAAAVGAAFAPLEATAPLWLIVGFASGGPAYDRVMAASRKRRLDQIERTLESRLRDLDAEQRRLLARRSALDARENEVSALGTAARAREDELARREAATGALEQDMVKREAALETGTWAISKAHKHAPAPAAAPPPQPTFRPIPPPVPQPRFRPAPAPPPPEPAQAVPPEILVPEELKPAPAPTPTLVLQPGPRTWSLRALAALVASRSPQFPDQAEEWRGYIAALESHAVDGVLPETLDQLVREVFGPILPAASG